jgi:hypothetical protein
MVFSLGAALGMGAASLGSQMLSQNAMQGAQRSERHAMQRQLRRRRRSPFGRALRESVSGLQDLATNLPGQMRADLRSQLQSGAAQQQSQLNQRLAQTGATAGGDVFGRNQRSLLSQLNQSRSGIESDVGRLESGLLGQLATTSRQAGEFLNPLTPVQEQTFVDPSTVLNQGLMGGFMGGMRQGTPGGGGGSLAAAQGAPSANAPSDLGGRIMTGILG